MIKRQLSAARWSEPRGRERSPGILVVDDDELIRGVMDPIFRQQGFRVWLAADGREAVSQYMRHRAEIDLALVEVHLRRGLDGPRTLAALRDIYPGGVRGFFMQGFPWDYTDEELVAFGGERIFPKPFPPKEVAVTLRQLTAGHLGCRTIPCFLHQSS